MLKDHIHWMKLALEEAEIAFYEDEIPVGAVILKNGELAAKNHNRTRQLSDPTAHCEKLIVEQIIDRGEKYLYNYTLYVTLEPCMMCAGMLVLARIGKIVFGCYDPKTGATGSLYNITSDKQLNHNPETISGILSDDCSSLLKLFFQSKR